MNVPEAWDQVPGMLFLVLLEISPRPGMLVPLSHRMPSVPPNPQAELPESLRLELEQFRRRLWREKALEAAAAAAIGLLVSFLLVYGLDRVIATPAWLRLLILLAGVSLFWGVAPYWLHRWVWKQRQETQLARLIARKAPGLGDRLLGVIELQNQQEHPDSLSPRLREAAMAAVAAETRHAPLTQALPPSRHQRWSLAAMGLALAAAVAFGVAPQAGWNALQRWLMPLSHTERFTFTRLSNPPTSLAVPFGEAFELRLELAPDSSSKPAVATARYASQPAVSAALRGNAYTLLFPGQQAPGRVRLRIGDLQHDISITPTPRPSVQTVYAAVSPPAYLGLGEYRRDLSGGVLQVVEGASVRIALEMNRPLAAATYGPASAGQDISSPSETQPGQVPDLKGPLVLSGVGASTPPIQIGSVPFDLPFSWQDTLGLAGESGFRLRVEAVKDNIPSCYLQGIDRQKAILPEETLDFEILAEDDFGLTATGIEWSGEPSQPSGPNPAKGEITLGSGVPGAQRVLKSAAFSPSAFGIGPQKLILRGFTGDAFPGRPRSYSEPVTLYVLSRDEHAQMLKNQFDRQISELEDLARRETSLLDENQRLERLEGPQLQQEEARKRLAQQQQEEADTQTRLDDLTRRMEQLMQDATRNGEIDPQTLKKLAESLKSMQELSQQDVPNLRKPLDQAGDPTNTPEQAAKEMDDAAAKQEKVVEKMRKAIEQANDANRRFEAGTFVNRLKKAASEQLGIVQSLKDAFSRVLGLHSRTVDPADLRRLDENVRRQSDTASDVRWLQEDLGHYHARTQNPAFKTILDAMKAANIDLALEEIRAKLQRNHSFQAAEEARRWGDQLNAWAKTLEGGNSQDNQGGGGGDSAPDAENEDFEFMLRVMKMVQQQQDLRGRTRTLEQLRRAEIKAATDTSGGSKPSDAPVSPNPVLPTDDPLLPEPP